MRASTRTRVEKPSLHIGQLVEACAGTGREAQDAVASVAICPQPACICLNLEWNTEPRGRSFHHFFCDLTGFLDDFYPHFQEHAVMDGQQHLDPIGQRVVEPYQRQLHQIGGGALDNRVYGLATGFSDKSIASRIDVGQLAAATIQSADLAAVAGLLTHAGDPGRVPG